MPINPDFTRLWMEAEDAPDSFIERFELQQRAVAMASEHVAKYDGPMPRKSLRGQTRHLVLRFLHPFGVHEWVRVLVYDHRVDRIIDPGRGRVICRNCHV